MVQLRIVSGSHDKIRLFITNVKSNSSSVGNVKGLLGVELGMCVQLLGGIEVGMCGQLLGIELGRCEQLLGIELGVGSCWAWNWAWAVGGH